MKHTVYGKSKYFFKFALKVVNEQVLRVIKINFNCLLTFFLLFGPHFRKTHLNFLASTIDDYSTHFTVKCYIKISHGFYNIKENGKTLNSITDLLVRHPELVKYILEFTCNCQKNYF